VAVPADATAVLVEGVGASRAELPFLAADKPWERANLFVNGTPQLDHNASTEAVVASPLGHR
jgi:hypothetical protein